MGFVKKVMVPLWILMIPLVLAFLFQDVAIGLMGINWFPIAWLGCVGWVIAEPISVLLLLVAVGIASHQPLRDILGVSKFRAPLSLPGVFFNSIFLITSLFILSAYFSQSIRGFPLIDLKSITLNLPRSCTFLPLERGGFDLFITEETEGVKYLYGILPGFLLAFLWALVQEVAFRGIAWHCLKGMGFSFWVTNFIQALLFSLPYHRPNLLGGFLLIVVALWWGWWRNRDGNIFTATILHTLGLTLVYGLNPEYLEWELIY